jgi:hypothetical protein
MIRDSKFPVDKPLVLARTFAFPSSTPKPASSCQTRLVESFDNGETIHAAIIAKTRSRERDALLPNINQ